MKKSRPGFTLIELLVVIAIIGLLATLSVIALSNARSKSRDSKRLADIRQMQTSLALYYDQAGRYPSASEFNSGSISATSSGNGTTTYMSIIPAAPTPNDGSCSTSSNGYIYTPNADGSSYTISFCIGSPSNNLVSGSKCATPGGIINVDCSGSSVPGFICGQTLIDVRDSQTYATVLIGAQCWMKQNLNIGTRINGAGNQGDYSGGIQKYCYNDSSATCLTDGGLYQWHMAAALPQACDNHDGTSPCVLSGNVQGICPSGWHLASNTEWHTLAMALGGETVVSPKLREAGTTHWASPNTGATNSSGFTALPSGERWTTGAFYQYAYETHFWTSTPNASATLAEDRSLDNTNASMYLYDNSRIKGLSVRCLKD